MELITKVTNKCDMACSFCSANNLCSYTLTPEEVISAANVTKANTLIILGGEALTLSPEYYFNILENTKDIKLDFTTNLKDFYLHPDKWAPLFRNERVHVCTSFNYGNTRKWDKDTIYTKDMFIRTEELFKEYVGYVPMFISVIDKNNVDTWRDHIELAKRLGTMCRLNNAMKFGRQDEYFPRSKLFKIWVQIIKDGNERYEANVFERDKGRCPINTSLVCHSTIRVVSKDDNGKIQFHNCDDRSNGCMAQIKENIYELPKKQKITRVISDKCYACELFRLCNACDTNVMQIIDKEDYCNDMLSIKDDIIKYGWKL